MNDPISPGSDWVNMTSAESNATWVPAPIAIPTSAKAREGASFTPSPTMITFFPSSLSVLTNSYLSCGDWFDLYSIPKSTAAPWAAFSLSPVAIIGRILFFLRALINSLLVGFNSSPKATAPMASSFSTKTLRVAPFGVSISRLRP